MHTSIERPGKLKVVIVGAGLGGLACAVACCQNGLETIVLERAAVISEFGAGINLPPNTGRLVRHLGYFDKLMEKSVIIDYLDTRRYKDGSMLLRRDVSADVMCQKYGAPWMVTHRRDFHRILFDAAIGLGTTVMVNAHVHQIDFQTTEVILKDGRRITSDVIIGADGLWSSTRSQILGRPSPPSETGDLAYRATFNTAELRALQDAEISKLIEKNQITIWLGPEKHCVLFPIQGGEKFNLVLLRPDNLPQGIGKLQGDLGEMIETFVGWDQSLNKLIAIIPNVLKWKLCYHEELTSWCEANVALLGDACHPTLPYQAQGAAMAVEDGAVIGRLFGLLLDNYAVSDAKIKIPDILKLYESMRKPRTTLNTQGAKHNRKVNHLPDGPEQEHRDHAYRTANWEHTSPYHNIDPVHQDNLLGFDVIKDCDEHFGRWLASQ